MEFRNCDAEYESYNKIDCLIDNARDMKDVLDAIPVKIKDAYQSGVDFTVESFEHAIEGTTNLFGQVTYQFDQIFSGIGSLIDSGTTWVRSGIDFARDAIGRAVDALYSSMQGVVFTMYDGIKDVITFIGNTISDVYHWAVDQFKAFARDWLTGFEVIRDWLSRTFNSVITTVKGWFVDAYERMKERLTTVKDWFGNTLKNIKAWFVDIYATVKETVQDVLSSLLEFFKDVWQDIKGWTKYETDEIYKGIVEVMELVVKAHQAVGQKLSEEAEK